MAGRQIEKLRKLGIQELRDLISEGGMNVGAGFTPARINAPNGCGGRA
jgi:hypothetical protein